MDLYQKQQGEDCVLEGLCATLIGDAGTRACFETITQIVRSEMESTTRYEMALDCCDALATRGLLADVPLLLAAYNELSYLDEADIIPIYIARLLEFPIGRLVDPRNYGGRQAYCEVVWRHYQGLKDKLVGDDPVFAGDRFSVPRMARLLLTALPEPYITHHWRRGFEASTGIDCRAFYKDRVIQPRAAAAIVERFLDSPSATSYQDGVRYFFAHGIPS